MKVGARVIIRNPDQLFIHLLGRPAIGTIALVRYCTVLSRTGEPEYSERIYELLELGSYVFRFNDLELDVLDALACL